MSQSSTPKAPKSLKQRFLAMSVWSVGQVGGELLLRLGGNLILTRLLMPEVFGLMAFALMIQAGTTMLTDIGVERSVIRDKDGDTDHYLRAAWTVRILRSGFITAIMVLIAVVVLPIWRQFAAEDSVIAAPEAVGVVAIIALTPLLRSLGSINEALAQRRLQLNRLVPLTLGSQILNLAMMVPAVWIWPTAWTMAIVLVTSTVIRAIASHYVLPGPRMQLLWDKAIAKRLWDYGKWLIGSSMFGFLARYGERLIFSSVLDLRLFALYSIARLWADAAQNLLSFVIQNAGMAALSEVVRAENRDVSGPFGKLQTVIDGICILGVAGYFFLIGPFIRQIYNEDFAAAAEFAPLLSLLALRMRFSTFGALMMSTGRTRTLMNCTIQEAIATWLLIWGVLQTLGFEAAIIAYCLSGLASVPYLLIQAKPLLKSRNFAIDWAWLGLSLVLGALMLSTVL